MILIRPLAGDDRRLIKDLYISAFPALERCPFEDLISYADRDDADVLGIFDDGLVGFSFTIFDADILFILYLAIDGQCRGKGIGSQALEQIQAMYPGRVCFIDAEAPYDDISESRIRFYQRSGFSRIGLLRCDEGDYVMMCRNGSLNEDSFIGFRERHDIEMLFHGKAEMILDRDHLL